MNYQSMSNMREFPNDVQLNTTLCINWIYSNKCITAFQTCIPWRNEKNTRTYYPEYILSRIKLLNLSKAVRSQLHCSSQFFQLHHNRVSMVSQVRLKCRFAIDFVVQRRMIGHYLLHCTFHYFPIRLLSIRPL